MFDVVLYALPPVMSVLNKLRGSGTEEFFGRGIIKKIFKNGAPIAAMGLFALMYAYSMDLALAGAVAGMWLLFETFAWGKWLSAVPHFFDPSWQGTYNATLTSRKDGKDNGIHKLATLVAKETTNFTRYCIASLVLRGVLWFAPVYAVLVAWEQVSVLVAIPAVAVIGVMFPISYILAHKINKAKYWPTGEYIYGGVYGAVLAASMLIN